MKYKMFVLAASLGLFALGTARAADFTLGFSPCPPLVMGLEGEVKTFDIYATLTTANNPGDGAQGWSLSIEATGWTINSVTLKGVTVDTDYCEDDDGDPGTACIEHPSFIQDLGDPTVFTKIANKATYKDDAARKGAISAVVLRGQEKMTLQPEGTQNILKINVSVTIPASEDCVNATLAFVDDFKSTVSQPVKNVITLSGASVTPASVPCVTCVKKIGPQFKLAVVPQGEDPLPNDADFVMGGDKLVGEYDIPVDIVLTTANLPGVDGPQGWSLSILNENCTAVTSTTLKGVTVDTYYCQDDDGDPGTPCIPLEHYTQDLGAPEVFTKIANKATGADPSPLPDDANGVISAVVLRGQEKMNLYANATDRILRIVYHVVVVEGANPPCTVDIVDGLRSSVSQPVNNVITVAGSSKIPTSRQKLVFQFNGITKRNPDQFRRGDANDDGKFNIADAVRVVMAVTQAEPILCIDAGDADANNRLEIPDAVYIIEWQFRHGLPPVAPYPDCGTDAESTDLTCPPDSTACPPLP